MRKIHSLPLSIRAHLGLSQRKWEKIQMRLRRRGLGPPWEKHLPLLRVESAYWPEDKEQERYPVGQCMYCGCAAARGENYLCKLHLARIKEINRRNQEDVCQRAKNYHRYDAWRRNNTVDGYYGEAVLPLREGDPMGKMEREKGARIERAACFLMREVFPDAARNLDQYQKTDGRDIGPTPGFCFQVKGGKAPSWKKALNEAAGSAEEDIPIALIKTDKEKWVVHLYAEDLLRILPAYLLERYAPMPGDPGSLEHESAIMAAEEVI